MLAERKFPGRGPERWVVLHLSSTYLHCRKHFPKADGAVQWGTDDARAKGSGLLRREVRPVAVGPLSHERQAVTGQRHARVAAHHRGPAGSKLHVAHANGAVGHEHDARGGPVRRVA